MKVVTCQQMQQIDQEAINNYGIPGIILMENAGLQVVREIEKHFSPLSSKKVAIIAGRGNNGGDGFVIARHLYNCGSKVKIYLLSTRDQVRGDARTNLDIITQMGLEIKEVRSINQMDNLGHFDLLIDAIFGTGLSSAIKGLYEEIICAMNDARRPIVSVDIPSGLSADRSELIGPHINADFTVTFGLPKLGLLLYPAAKHAGKLTIAEISIPKPLLEKEDIKINLLTKDMIRAYIPERQPDAHKGSFGHMLVVAGSWGKTGAAAMASYAGLRTGAGLVTLALPKSLNMAMETASPEVMTLPLAETPDGTIDLEAKEKILEFLDEMKIEILVMGPGLSTHPQTGQLVRELLNEVSVPIVIDADGINVLCSCQDILKRRKGPLILTPHPGEMARLLGLPVQEIQRDRVGIAQKFAQEYQIFLVLKGAITVIGDPEGNIFLNPTGNPGMATAGMGDVLTGMLGGFLAQRWPFLKAINVAVFLHGLAGDLTAQEIGPVGITATDLLDRIPLAIKTVLDGRN
jgi:ADP-dependent NAD(P)H-hydrate dehydratase / NAD(P)H-hydrate epimerase